MTVTIDWNAWRAGHSTMTFADQQAFYELVAIEHPVQQHFHLDAAHHAFDEMVRSTGGSLRVVELGGWDGALADAMLSRPYRDVARWTNYDLIAVPQVPTNPSYELVVLFDYLWNVGYAIKGDVFVSTHTIEHLTGAQLEQLVGILDTEWVYLESPLEEEGQQWYGYQGTHILELGWRDVRSLLTERGYDASLPIARNVGLWRKSSPDKERERS